ncbi:BPSS1780 family membrane protein [Oleiagrimonas soli]|uniref:ABC-type multidrug transport system permease subunit n=1 Tax=Oleiagrimonas soli TaxID=1543381 RepID=A0A099CSM7_9GAMM|nr:BPSS1780 family membrane protein [Oleiagrimonas soli]KGI76612.1 hypothetical protein LF63_0115010 [Oleiagrimonas soli]MBB6184904.1 ABC-type multidrug transport system permease subunit [Oleiagrimonas soli]
MRKVDVGASIEWIGAAFAAVRAHPAAFLVMGLIFTVIPLVPLLGGIVILLLGPALLAGMIYAAREADQGRTPKVGHLFQAFQDGDRIGSLIALCLPVFAALLLMIVVAMPIIIAIANSGQIDAQTLSDQAALAAALHPILSAMAGRLLLTLVLIVVIAFVAGMLTFLAAACIMLGRDPAFVAMRKSFAACARNFGAYLITVLLLGLGLGLLRIVLSQLLPEILAAVLTSTPYYALLGPLTYAAYRSIFGDDTSAPVNEAAPPPPPSSSHTLEA